MMGSRAESVARGRLRADQTGSVSLRSFRSDEGAKTPARDDRRRFDRDTNVPRIGDSFCSADHPEGSGGGREDVDRRQVGGWDE